MDIKRKAYSRLLQWKTSDETQGKAILIKGARRVGKSYLAELFAREEYRSYLLIDFSSPRPGTLQIFREFGNRESLNEFFNQLSVLYGIPLYRRRSALIFDEIQMYPQARALVKHLVADGRYDVIETGSLISIKKNVKDILIPSEEEELFLHPLDFEEFLGALHDEVTLPCLMEAFHDKNPLGNLLKPIMERLRIYMLVGGMPQAVAEYASSANIDRVEAIKRNILRLYRDDIAKYAENYIAEAASIFDAIPSQLSHHDKKIKYSSLKPNSRFSGYRDALFWMADSMVGNLCIGVDAPELFQDFSLNASKVKCYLNDTGLLLTHAAGKSYLHSDLYKSFMLGKLSVNQGMMTENLVAQMLTASGHPLRFYEKRLTDGQKVTKYEVDFLLQTEGKTIPIEVKSSKSSHHPSLDYFSRRFRAVSGKSILLTKGDLRETENYLYLPLPMAMFL